MQHVGRTMVEQHGPDACGTIDPGVPCHRLCPFLQPIHRQGYTKRPAGVVDFLLPTALGSLPLRVLLQNPKW